VENQFRIRQMNCPQKEKTGKGNEHQHQENIRAGFDKIGE